MDSRQLEMADMYAELITTRQAYVKLQLELERVRPVVAQLIHENAVLRRALIDHELFRVVAVALMAEAHQELQREAQEL